MAPKTSRGKGVAKDAGEREAPESELAARWTQLAFFPSTVDAIHLRDYFKPLWGCKTKGHPATRIIPVGFAEAGPNRDMETLAQRVAKRARVSTGGQPPAGSSREERQQEEPPRATPNMPPLSTTPPRGESPARASTAEPTPMEEEETNLGAGGPTPATNVGREGATSFQPGAGTSSADQENIDTVIEEVTRDAEAEANKIATEEAAKSTDEDAAKGPADKAATKEAGKDVAEEGAVYDQPSSSAASGSGKYLKVSDDLFVLLPGAVAQDLLAERKLELVMKQADIEKAQETASEQATKDEAARHQHQAVLNSQEEDLATHEEKLAATLRGKDEEKTTKKGWAKSYLVGISSNTLCASASASVGAASATRPASFFFGRLEEPSAALLFFPDTLPAFTATAFGRRERGPRGFTAGAGATPLAKVGRGAMKRPRSRPMLGGGATAAKPKLNHVLGFAPPVAAAAEGSRA
nr:protein wings apart-like [Aegilops tauschii subsp. strangulata]